MIYPRRYLLTANSTSETVPRVEAVKTPAAMSPEAVAQQQSDFVVILAALLCALICVFGLIAVARCAWLRRRAGGIGRATAYPSANKGLKKKVLQSLPKYTYDSASAAEIGKAGSPSPAAASPARGPDCAICLAEYIDGEEIRVLPQCGHRFHVQCIDTWLGSHSSCPSCRQVLATTRCRKCGEFPTVSAVNSSGSGGGSEVKPPAASTSSSTFLP